MLFTKDASYYAKQIKNGQVTSQDLVDQALANIDELNPSINAVVHIQREDALKRAKELDQIFQQSTETEDLPPFIGVPILLKNLGQNQAGQPSTSGSKLLKDSVASQSDQYVLDIERAGFVVVGRTNVPEFGFKGISDSAHYGEVNLPQDPSRNPGGSSGGAAASLQAGLVPIVAASDGGGSIRIPASYTGQIGLKPTRGRISVGPTQYRGWQGASIDFALTKSIEDTWGLLKALQSEKGHNPFPLSLIKETDLKDLDHPLKIAYWKQAPPGKATDPEAIETINHTVEVLEALGHTLVEDFPQVDLSQVLDSYFLMNGVETAAMFDDIEANLNRKIEPSQVEPLSYGIYLSGQKILAKEFTKILTFWDRTAAILEDFLEDYDLILLPSTNGSAPKHGKLFDTITDDLKEKLLNLDTYDISQQKAILDQAWIKSTTKTPYTPLQNVTGQPAISLPLYENKNGLPVGSQFWGAKGTEYLLLQLGKQLEEAGALKIKHVSHLKNK